MLQVTSPRRDPAAPRPAPPPRERPADTAEQLNRSVERDAVAEVAELAVERAVDVFDQPFLTRGATLLRSMPIGRARAILDGMAVDRQAEVFRQARPADRDALFPLLDAHVAKTVRDLLAYPRDSAGSIMTT